MLSRDSLVYYIHISDTRHGQRITETRILIEVPDSALSFQWYYNGIPDTIIYTSMQINDIVV